MVILMGAGRNDPAGQGRRDEPVTRPVGAEPSPHGNVIALNPGGGLLGRFEALLHRVLTPGLWASCLTGA
jgi:hypothetical protein